MASSFEHIAIVTGARAPELERYAAGELCRYLRQLFGIEASSTSDIPASADCLFLIGSAETNPAVKAASARHPFPEVSGQGIVLRAIRLPEGPALLVGGGSPRATLWAVYELVERWGVRYLLHGDVLPELPVPRDVLLRCFALAGSGPGLQVVMEPELPVRSWRVINDFAMGPESWGMADYRPVIDQLAKLKFNHIAVAIYPWQPFLRLEVQGIQRKSAWLWYDYHYPITDDMPGRRLFGDAEEFWNPDLPRGASYKEFSAAGERLVHNLMAYARERGLGSTITAWLCEFPPEFAPLLKDPQKVHQLGELTIVPGANADVDDSDLGELAAAVLRATVNTYPEADRVALAAPEFRQWTDQYERAWRALDARYGIEKIRPLSDVLAAARERVNYWGGGERAAQEVKGDIVTLYFYDRLINDLGALRDTRRPDMRFQFPWIAEELFPVLPRVMPPGSELINVVDYTPSRVLRRREVLGNIVSRDVDSLLVCTLHDDNIGILPQLMTGSLHELISDIRRHGWAGIMTRYWLIGDHDPCVAYLAKAAWDTGASPEAVYQDQIRAACGQECVEDVLIGLREVEGVTLLLEENALGLTFPTPGLIMRQWRKDPMPAEWVEARRGYQRALDAMRRAQPKAHPCGRSYIEYWVGRLKLGIGLLDAIEAVRGAAAAEAGNESAETLRHTERALSLAVQAIEAFAAVARDQSDRGAIASLDEYVYRPLKAKVAELRSV